jgi:hypothetical protein
MIMMESGSDVVMSWLNGIILTWSSHFPWRHLLNRCLDDYPQLSRDAPIFFWSLTFDSQSTSLFSKFRQEQSHFIWIVYFNCNELLCSKTFLFCFLSIWSQNNAKLNMGPADCFTHYFFVSDI